MEINCMQECVSNSLCSTTPSINTSDCFTYRSWGRQELRSLELGLTALLTLGPVWCNGFNAAERQRRCLSAESSS